MQGDHFIQLERRGLHHINSHVALIMDDDDQGQELFDDSDGNDDFDDDEDSETKMIPTTKIIARIIPRIIPTVSNSFVCCIGNCLNNYLVVFRYRHCSQQQQTPVGSICCMFFLSTNFDNNIDMM